MTVLDHMGPLRLYLLCGLLIHKLVWEVLKRNSGQPATGNSAPSLFALAAKAVKIAILLGIIAQTLLPEILPITESPGKLKLVGVVVYTVGLFTAIAARLQLGRNWFDIESPDLAASHTVVASGVYRCIRHPIYTGDVLLLTGLELALNSWLALGVLLLIPVVHRQAGREETMLAGTLSGYGDYCRRTKRFLPFVW